MHKPTLWLVTTRGDRPLEEVAAELRRLGFGDLELLEAIGCLTGSASKAAAAAARRLPGIVDVAPDHPVDLDPQKHGPTW